MKKMIAWVEIPTENFERAVKFYNFILELDLKPLDFGQEKMACLPNDEGAIIYAQDYKPSKDGVIVSLNCGDQLDTCLEKIEKSQGIILRPKTKIEAEGRGYFAVFIDSEGNRMGLYGDQ